MDRDSIVFWSCIALGAAALPLEGCCTSPHPPIPEKSQAEICAEFARGAEWIRTQGAPLNVTNERALANNAAEARKAGCQ